jgi:hypothetical protein
MINSTLISIDAKFYCFGDEGVKYLSEALKINSALISLALTNNFFGKEDAKYLSEFL